MKLRNKKTGEILEEARSSMVYEDNFTIYDERADRYFTYTSLAELNAEWEDVLEEPKKHYEILGIGVVIEQKDTEDEIFRNQNQREIGNYFKSKEEAEKAVEKLKAWKGLKDKGFRFLGIKDLIITYSLGNYDNSFITQINKDLELLFGGEE